jgi:hypothetical protein
MWWQCSGCPGLVADEALVEQDVAAKLERLRPVRPVLSQPLMMRRARYLLATAPQ